MFIDFKARISSPCLVLSVALRWALCSCQCQLFLSKDIRTGISSLLVDWGLDENWEDSHNMFNAE